MDVLSDVLKSVRLKGVLSGQIQLSAPWGIKVDSSKHANFCFVKRGSAYLTLQSHGGPVAITGGDFLLLPRVRGYVLQDRLESPTVNLFDLFSCENPPETTTFGGGGAATTLIMGCFEFDCDDINPLMNVLPELVHIMGDHGELEASLDTTLKLIASETNSKKPGTEFTVSRLTEVLFAQVIRKLAKDMVKCNESRSWLKALTDDQIGKALTYIHANSSQSLTLDDLAKQSGMSRSAFAAKFANLTDYTPAQYVTLWRMHTAGQLLKEGKHKVAAIAAMVGYESEASFGTAFKRVYGCAPRAYAKSKSTESDRLLVPAL
ncbi:MAG: AraC family transcriptional regulator [Leptolyngbya sp.]|nr:AraC family transcriptional regulator [Candidatus Melainabacteria bacterium]